MDRSEEELEISNAVTRKLIGGGRCINCHHMKDEHLLFSPAQSRVWECKLCSCAVSQNLERDVDPFTDPL